MRTPPHILVEHLCDVYRVSLRIPGSGKWKLETRNKRPAAISLAGSLAKRLGMKVVEKIK